MNRLRNVAMSVLAFMASIAMMCASQTIAAAAISGGNDELKAVISNVRVSDVGTHTADVAFDWSIDGISTDQIVGICFIVDVNRITAITPMDSQGIGLGAKSYSLPCEGGVGDDVEQDGQKDDPYVSKEHELTLPNELGQMYTAATYQGQQFYRYAVDQWDGRSLSGTAVISLAGLEAGTLYGNTVTVNSVPDPNPLWPIVERFNALWQAGIRETTAVDVRTLYAGLELTTKADGQTSRFMASKVADFKTIAEQQSDRAAVYRAYNPNQKMGSSHLYTTNRQEYDHAVQAGWTAEGEAFYTVDDPTAAPVYRLYNPYDGSHHYTAAPKEQALLLAQGWRDEGIGWRIPADASNDVFRLYNPNTGEHLFTVDSREQANALAAGWGDEGIAFKVYAGNA